MNLGKDMIRRLGGKKLSVTRTLGGWDNEGKWEASGTEQKSIWMSVQPLTARETEFQEEGYRDRDIRKAYSEKELRADTTETGASADRVLYLGTTYRVIRSEPWNGHWKVVMVAEEKDYVEPAPSEFEITELTNDDDSVLVSFSQSLRAVSYALYYRPNGTGSFVEFGTLDEQVDDEGGQFTLTPLDDSWTSVEVYVKAFNSQDLETDTEPLTQAL